MGSSSLDDKVMPFIADDGKPINRHTMEVLIGWGHPAAVAQMAGAGMKRDDRYKAHIAVLHNEFTQNSCNMHL